MHPTAPNVISKKNRALVLAHYHRNGKLRTDTINFLNDCQNEFGRIIVISTNLVENERNKVPSFVELHIRKNIGYDFFSYRLGISHLFKNTNDGYAAEKKISQVTIMNTSFVIFNSKKFLQNYFNEVVEKIDFYGLTMYTGHGLYPHLQSFLLTFNDLVLSDKKFWRWWDEMTPHDDKAQVIQKYEVGLTELLVKLGYRPKSLFPVNPYAKYADPMHGSFMEIFEKYSILKIGLFVTNPFKLSLRSINLLIKENEQFKNLIVEGMDN